jgi:hypothetical protein
LDGVSPYILSAKFPSTGPSFFPSRVLPNAFRYLYINSFHISPASPCLTFTLSITSRHQRLDTMIKRSLLFPLALPPLVLACDNADTDACASAYTASAAAAITFCERYTKSTVTATTSLPALRRIAQIRRRSFRALVLVCLVPLPRYVWIFLLNEIYFLTIRVLEREPSLRQLAPRRHILRLHLLLHPARISF